MDNNLAPIPLGRPTIPNIPSTRPDRCTNTKKTVFDAWNEYILISQSMRRIATTPPLSPHGADTCTALLHRDTTSGEYYTRRYDEIVFTILDETKCINEILLWADNLFHSFHQTTWWLDICGRHGVTLNPDKFQFGMGTVDCWI